jgi:FMN-dependent NADH-azoreductase
MSELLHIEASPSGLRSHSSSVAAAYLEVHAQLHGGDSVRTLNLWQTTLPAFDEAVIEAKFAVLRKNAFTPKQLEVWNRVRAVAEDFCSADEYVISVPMWNFGVPYVLKHYIDVVTLADINWSWSRGEGYKGLLKNKSATLIYSSAGDYPTGPESHPHDFQKPYLRKWLSFIGIDDVREINVAPTLVDPDTLAQVKARAIAQAQQLAAVQRR